VHDPLSHRVFVGCGLGADDALLDDFWIFDTNTEAWLRVRLSGARFPERCGARAVFHNGRLYVFGGYGNGGYLSDLHTIAVDTGEIAEVKTSGAVPAGRTSPLFAASGNSLYVWGGFNGEFPSALSVLDLETLVWEEFPQEIEGRIPSPGAVFRGEYVTYGASKSGKMVVLNFEAKRISDVPTRVGAEPPSSVVGAGLVLVEKYLFFFGGKAATEWGLLHACDLERMWWFVFHVAPDSSTVTYADGKIDSVGLFMMPRMHSFCMCYAPERREILSFLGAPLQDPPPIHAVAIAKALGCLHMREDMLVT
jgi:hypothetical protein